MKYEEMLRMQNNIRKKPKQEEHRIQADADLDGGRDIDAAAFLHEDGQADEGKLNSGISGIAEQGKERAAAPEKVHRGGAGEHHEKEARAEDIYDARRFFAEYLFEHGSALAPVILSV